MQVLCLKRQLQLQLDKQATLSEAVAAATASLQSLQQRQQQALHDVEVQLRLKQGQVGCAMRFSGVCVVVSTRLGVSQVCGSACSSSCPARFTWPPHVADVDCLRSTPEACSRLSGASLPIGMLLPHQVEVWPAGLASITPETLLVARQEVKGLNSIILSKVRQQLHGVTRGLFAGVEVRIRHRRTDTRS